MCIIANQLDATLGLYWPNTFETARAGVKDISEDLPPLSRQQTELSMEILKVLFNITFTNTRHTVDEVLKCYHQYSICSYHAIITQVHLDIKTFMTKQTLPQLTMITFFGQLN